MKKFILALGMAAFAFTSQAQRTTVESIAIGTAIPYADMQVKSAQHQGTSLKANMTSKGLLVMFSCNTCPYVIKAENRTKEAMAMAKRLGIGMVIVNSNDAQRGDEDSPEAMTKYAAAQGYMVPYLMDYGSTIANNFGANRTPEVFLFDGKGLLAYKGAMEDNPSNPSASKEMYLNNAMMNMVAGKEISPNSTKSIGCSIKRMER